VCLVRTAELALPVVRQPDDTSHRQGFVLDFDREPSDVNRTKQLPGCQLIEDNAAGAEGIVHEEIAAEQLHVAKCGKAGSGNPCQRHAQAVAALGQGLGGESGIGIDDLDLLLEQSLIQSFADGLDAPRLQSGIFFASGCRQIDRKRAHGVLFGSFRQGSAGGEHQGLEKQEAGGQHQRRQHRQTPGQA